MMVHPTIAFRHRQAIGLYLSCVYSSLRCKFLIYCKIGLSWRSSQILFRISPQRRLLLPSK